MHMTRLIGIVALICLATTLGLAWAQTVPENARRYMDRGQAAVEMAKTNVDLEDALKEFQKAAQSAPSWAEPYYHMGVVQNRLGRLDDALTSLKRCLQVAPGGKNAQAAQQLINKIEYVKEKETGIRRVYELMAETTNRVQWVKISQKGADGPDWEIEHNEDFDGYKPPENRKQPVFIMKDGALYKNGYSVEPMNYYIAPDPTYGKLPVKVDGRFFEYTYPVALVYALQRGEYSYGKGGEMSIKGEIISFDPPRVKRVQRLKLPEGKTSVTEYVYELRKR